MTPEEQKESARWASIAEVHRLQQSLHYKSNEDLIMCALAELLAYMPKAPGGETREALWRELWRRGANVESERGR